MAELDWASMHKDATTTIEGEFNFVIVEANATKTQTGKDMLKCKVQVESGVYAGRPLWHNFTVSPESPAAMRMFFSQMSVLGLNGDWFTRNAKAPMEQLAKTLEGRRFIGKVGTRQWQGADREEIQEFKPALGGGTVSASVVQAGMSRGTVGTPVADKLAAAAATTGITIVESSTAPPADPTQEPAF